ncbi:hypothetical protein D3C83_313070 [compost metagenome]
MITPFDRLFGHETIDLIGIEDIEAERQEFLFLAVAGNVLPFDAVGALLAFADLRAERRPLFVGRPLV